MKRSPAPEALPPRHGPPLPSNETPDDVLDVDVEKHLRWLESGEGEPWPPASRS
jgi:hypothetical protein